ncbi:MAG TPA: DNA replication protein DnaC [Oribacterium sp.]|nr:DNA replication protein DnaC [Oribacterium sp.]HCS67557.1 DNA replication protein DnaC [Oribacterium sp.]
MALTNAQYNQIMHVYDVRRMRDAAELEARKKDAYEKLPALKTLEASVRTEAAKTLQLMREGRKEELQHLKARIAEIGEEKRALLRAQGLPEDYLEPQYTCRDCKDTGFIHGEKCHCFKEMQMRFIYQQSHLDTIVRTQNFHYFDLQRFDDTIPVDGAGGRTNRQYMAEVRNMLYRWTQHFDAQHGNVILMGNPGTGKTFLINCVAKALMDSYHSVIYLTSTDLFESFSKAMRHMDAEQEETEEAIMNCDLLVIDDLGTEMNNSYTTSRLFYVLNQRMVLHKSVMISTNLNFRAMQDRYSDRIVSRIMAGYEIIPLYGVDQRLR